MHYGYKGRRVPSSQFSVNTGPIVKRLRTENRELLFKTKRPPGNVGSLFFKGE
jgi:hypothetical protein